MDTFGERLRNERESRGLTLEAVAETLAIDPACLQALEGNDFQSLPEEGVMMGCLRAYAECLEVDSGLMIADYLQERERCLAKLSADLDAIQAAEMEVASGETGGEAYRPVGQVNAWDPAPHRAWRLRWVVLGVVVLLGAWWMLSGGGEAAPAQATEASPVAEPAMTVEPAPAAPAIEASALPEQERVESSTPRIATTPATGTRSAPETPATAPTPGLSVDGLHVPESAIGSDVRNKKLVGATDQFRAGSAAWFWTRAEGGQRGDRIEHVWLHEGEPVARIGLRIGGSSWRTYSSKILRSIGEWTVEARDAEGRVLARRDFSVSP